MNDRTAKASNPAVLTPDLCVIGAGARGIAIASAAAAFGVPVVLVERGQPGGRETELVLKALVEAAAKTAAIATEAGSSRQPADAARLHDHLQRARSVAAANSTAERLRALGITLLEGQGRFVSRSTVGVGEQLIKARRFVVATGSRPEVAAPLATLPPGILLTEDDLATMTRLPERLAVVGTGPRAVAAAQAMQRLGCRVALVSSAPLLIRCDAEAVMTLRRQLLREGLVLHEEARLRQAEAGRTGARLVIDGAAGEIVIEADRILVADDRSAEIDGLELDLAGIRRDGRGIVVDAGLRTDNRRVYAVGSCAGGAAGDSAEAGGDDQVGIVLRHALFRRSSRIAPALQPRIVWTRPEIAWIGAVSPPDATRLGSARVLRWPFAETPAALAAGESQGFVKVMSDAKGRILAATIVGEGAGEMIAPWCVALKTGLRVQEMASLTVPALSRAEASRRAALSFHLPATTSPAVRRLIGFLRRFG